MMARKRYLLVMSLSQFCLTRFQHFLFRLAGKISAKKHAFVFWINQVNKLFRLARIGLEIFRLDSSLLFTYKRTPDIFFFTILAEKYVPRQLLAIYVLSMQVKGSTVVVHLFYDWKTFLSTSTRLHTMGWNIFLYQASSYICAPVFFHELFAQFCNYSKCFILKVFVKTQMLLNMIAPPEII